MRLCFKHPLLFLFLIAALFCRLSAQIISADIEDQFVKYGETWLRVPLKNRSDIARLSSFSSVAGTTGDTALVNVSPPIEMLRVNLTEPR